MPGLTVTKKSHWRDRIAARITREAHTRALASLGLAAAYAELEAIKLEEAGLARRKKQS